VRRPLVARAGALVVLAASLAVASNAPPGVDVVVDAPPGPIDIVTVTPGTIATGSLTLDNLGPTMTQLTSIDRDACDPEATAVATSTLPVTLGTQAVAVACDYTHLTDGSGVSPIEHPDNPITDGGAISMTRCQFHARDAAVDLTDFTVICVPQSSFTLGESTGEIDFGNVQVDSASTMQVTITNGSTAAHVLSLQITDQAGNFKVGAPCTQDVVGCAAPVSLAANGTTTVDVQCTPTATGALTSSLLVVTDNGGRAADIALTCTGTSAGAGPQITLDKTSLDVGGVQVSSGTAAGTIHVSNTGTTPLTISSFSLVGGAASEWSLSATAPCDVGSCMLAVGASTDVTATLDPAQLNARATTLQIDSDDVTHSTVDVALTGTGLGGVLALDTTLGSNGIDLGDVPIGGMTAFPIVLRDDGNQDLTDVTVAISPPDGYTIDKPALTVPESATATATITCAPTSVASLDATVTIASLSALSGSPISFPITCAGIAGSMQASPSTLALGEVRTNDGLVMKTITLTDVGSGNVSVADPTLENGSDAVGSAELSLGAVSTHTITPAVPATFTVTIDPQADGPISDTIAVMGGSALVEIPVTGQVVTAAVTAPASRLIGSFCVNQPTTTSNVSLVASGTASINLTAPTLAGSDASPFQLADVAPTMYPSKLPAGGSATVSITPKREATALEATDTIVWATDAPDPQPTTTIIADFISDGGAIAPATLDFGTVPIHMPVPNDQLVTIQNCGTAPMMLDTPTITPTGAFDVDGAPLPAMLAASASATVSVGFAPVAAGTFDATLAVSSSSGMLQVSLHGVGAVTTGSGSGSGLGMAGDSNDDTTDFYACGCHADADPSTAGALALVGMCALLPRRRRRRPRLR
jgi:MYXO-CTERM domain-containing protein